MKFIFKKIFILQLFLIGLLFSSQEGLVRERTNIEFKEDKKKFDKELKELKNSEEYQEMTNEEKQTARIEIAIKYSRDNIIKNSVKEIEFRHELYHEVMPTKTTYYLKRYANFFSFFVMGCFLNMPYKSIFDLMKRKSEIIS